VRSATSAVPNDKANAMATATATGVERRLELPGHDN
jgi:hypothetical protein